MSLETRAEELISLKDRDVDEMTPHIYKRRNALSVEMFGTASMHDAFAATHPEFCFRTVIWVVQHGRVKDLSKAQGTIYSDGRVGAEISVHPSKNNLFPCLIREECGIYLYLQGHSNILWISGQDIYRYDPSIPKTEGVSLDVGLRAFFAEALPNHTYHGNVLSAEECIQNVRMQERGILDCFCQEYTLLYALNRIDGMDHRDAAKALILSDKDLLDEIFQLYISLSEGYIPA